MIKRCNRCKWYLSSIDHVKRDGSGDVHVCGETLTVIVDEVGIRKFKTHGEKQHCEECGQVLQDNRRVAYQTCMERNKNYKCTVFRPTILWYPIYLFEKIRGKIK